MVKNCSTVLHLNGILFKVCRWILLIPLCDTLWQSLTLARPAKTSACWRERVRTAAVDPTDRTPAFCLHIWCSISRLFTLFTGEPHHFQVLSPFWLLAFQCFVGETIQIPLQHSGVPSCPWFPGVEENGPFWNRNDFTILRLAMVLAHTHTGIFESIKSFTFDTLLHVFVLFNRPSFRMISSNFIKHLQLSVINCHSEFFFSAVKKGLSQLQHDIQDSDSQKLLGELPQPHEWWRLKRYLAYTHISKYILIYIYIALQSMVVSPLHHHHLNYLPEIHRFSNVISIFFGSTDWSKKARCQLSRSLIFGCISAHPVTNFNGLQPFTTFLEHLKKSFDS